MNAGRINFRLLGYHVPSLRTGPISSAGRNTGALALSGRTLLPMEGNRAKYAAVTAALSRLLLPCGISMDKFTVRIERDLYPNALIVPDTRLIVITEGVFLKENLTEGEVSFVLAHELGHWLTSTPGKKLPSFMKGNPLWRQYFTIGESARCQGNEYTANEIALVLLDAAGHSVLESVSMSEWLGREEVSSSIGGKVLAPGGTHPRLANCTAVLREICVSSKFLWKNRDAKPVPFKYAADITELSAGAEAVSLFNIKTFFSKGKVLSMKKVKEAAEKLTLLRGGAHFFSVAFLSEKEIGLFSPRLKGFILELKKERDKQDAAAAIYLEILLAAAYFQAAREDQGKKLAEWLAGECGVGEEEVILSLLSALRDYYRIESITGEEEGEGFSDFTEEGLLSVELAETIKGFSPSLLRDELIFLLLKEPFLIKDRGRYIENPNGAILEERDGFAYKDLRERKKSSPFPLFDILFGSQRVRIESFYARTGSDNLRNKILEEVYGGEQVDMTLDERLSIFCGYVCELGGPIDRKLLEEIIAENNHAREITLLWKEEDVFFDVIIGFHLFLLKLARKIPRENPDKKKRILELAGIIFAGSISCFDPSKWPSKALKEIDALPSSSEKNFLLILLHKTGRRKLDRSLLVFEEIPRPDSLGHFEENPSLINSFGFISPALRAAAYPEGQRALDQLIAEELKAAPGYREIMERIPRPSPIRDDLLANCRPRDKEEAKTILGSFWSPAAAYAMAYRVCRDYFMESLDAIVELTADFPSLRRRMVGEWADRFGVTGENYGKVLSAGSDFGTADVLKGSAIDFSGRAGLTEKIALALVPFAVALSREKFSMLTFKDEGEGPLEETFFEEEGEEEMEEPETEGKGPGIEEAIKKEREIFYEYASLFPENAHRIARWITERNRFVPVSISFVDDSPAPNRRFERALFASKAGELLGEWKGRKVFGDFMQAMGFEESIIFFENLFFGGDGIINRGFLTSLEPLFYTAIRVLLQEKKVPLARVEATVIGIQTLFAHLGEETRGKIWSRVLAGIAQKDSLGAIVREGVKPLGTPGGKLMQAIHSLVSGEDATLEEATRMALDQTDAYSTLGALQFVGFRGEDLFSKYRNTRLLGQGTNRTAIAAGDERAYLLVHSGKRDPSTVRSITRFIRELEEKGSPFPLSSRQFKGLVEQAEEERTAGFKNHRRYGEHFDWSVGELRIPKILEDHGDWAELELVKGISFSRLSEEQKPPAAQKILNAAFAQFTKPLPNGKFFINPEMHEGNILMQENGNLFLIDCGLVAEVSMEEATTFFSLLSAFKREGLFPAAASLFGRAGITSLSRIPKGEEMIRSLKTISKQLDARIPPELLVSSLAAAVERSGGPKVTLGIDSLYRAVQHLAPYFRLAEQLPFEWPASAVPAGLAEEFKAAAMAGEKESRGVVAVGIAVGKRYKGQVYSIGVLTEPLDLSGADALAPGMVKCVVPGATRQIKREELVIQIGSEWKRTE